MKTRSSEFKTVKSKKCKSRVQNVKVSKKSINSLRNKKKSEFYKRNHAVGRRQSSGFVTYTQNGRLFYDIYARDFFHKQDSIYGAYVNKSPNISKVEEKKDKKLKCKNEYSKSLLNSEKPERLSKRVACLNATAKLRLLSKENKVLNKLKLNKFNEISSGNRKKSTIKIAQFRRSLKRELGIEAQSVELVHGRRIASLNASAIMSASMFDNRNLRNNSNNLISDKKADCLANDDCDDAVTEPMCNNSDSDVFCEIDKTNNMVDVHVKPIVVTEHEKNRQEPSLSKISENSEIENVCVQKIIPVDLEPRGLQKISQQIVLASSSETPFSYSSSHEKNVGMENTSQMVYGTICQNFIVNPVKMNNDYLGTSFSPPQIIYNTSPNLVSFLQPCIQWPQSLVYNPVVYPHALSVNRPLQSGTITNVNTNGLMLNISNQLSYPIVYYPSPNFNNYGFVNNLLNSRGLATCNSSSNSYYQPINFTCNNGINVNRTQLIKSIPISSFPSHNVPSTNFSSLSIKELSNNCCSVNKENNIHKLSGKNKRSLQKLTSYYSKNQNSKNTMVRNVTNTTNSTKSNEALCNCLKPIVRDNKILELNNYTEVESLLKSTNKIIDYSLVDIDSNNSWVWEGESSEGFVFTKSDVGPVLRTCYPAIRHENDGIVIRVKDNVLLCSGPNRSQPPHVAKITALFVDESSKDKMMSLLWYYRPEHTATTTFNGFIKNELYSSRHRDTNPVNCIEDKAYVLSLNAYARFMARMKYKKAIKFMRNSRFVVPKSIFCELHDMKSDCGDEESVIFDQAPSLECDTCLDQTDASSVFFCRGVFDFKLKRLSKSPIFGTPGMPISMTTRLKTNSRIGQNLDKDLHSSDWLSPPKSNPSQSDNVVVDFNNNSKLNICNRIDSTIRSHSIIASSDDTKSVSNESILTQTSTLTNSFDQPISLKPDSNLSPSCIIETNCPTSGTEAGPRLNSCNLTKEMRKLTNYDLYSADQMHTSSPVKTLDSKSKTNGLLFGSNLNLYSATPLTNNSWNLTNYERPVLDKSADLSVNWAEHGEQIALSLDCRGQGLTQSNAHQSTNDNTDNIHNNNINHHHYSNSVTPTTFVSNDLNEASNPSESEPIRLVML